MYICESVCLHVGVCGSLESTLDTLELELQAVLSHTMYMLEFELWPSEEQGTLLTAVLSFQPLFEGIKGEP